MTGWQNTTRAPTEGLPRPPYLWCYSCMSPSSLRTPDGYRALSEADLGPFLATTPLAQVLGGGPADWSVREVGDGNLNLVSIVTGPAGGVAVKQALPYVRLVGESWPLPLDRAHFEHLALLEQARHAADRVPRVLYYQPELALLALELLTPHIILRRGMIQGIRYPLFARHIATFIARTAFYTSDLALEAAAKKALWQQFASNTALCKISEDLIFTEPYTDALNNRWTSPQLDVDVRAIRADAALKVAICELKEIFRLLRRICGREIGQPTPQAHATSRFSETEIRPKSVRIWGRN